MSEANRTESSAERAVRVKGYGSSSFRSKEDVRKSYRSADGLSVEPVVVTSLAEYIDEISSLHDDTITVDNPMFYHGHTNIDYILLPTVMRGVMSAEKQLFDEFRRRFPNELKDCRQTVEKLAFMQHYGLYTRCLDLSENPLIGLHFAVSDMVKFRTEVDKNRNNWGEVVLIHLQKDDTDDIKYFDSPTVSVISNVAQLGEDFCLQQVQLLFIKDRQQTSLDNFIYFRDILRRSVIVRTKQDNPRIINQRGAFILVNANEITDIFDGGIYGRRNAVGAEEFTSYIYGNSDEVRELNLWGLQHGQCDRYRTEFKNTEEWDFKFRKVKPYSLENKSRVMQNDPFDLKRMLFRNRNGSQKVILIPPDAKTRIKRELQMIGITEEFVYPEIDSVSYALNGLFFRS